MSDLRWILLGLAVLVFVGTLIWSRFSRKDRERDLFDLSGSGNDGFDKDVLFADDPLDIEEDFGVSEVRILKSDPVTTSGTHQPGTNDAGSLTAKESSSASAKSADSRDGAREQEDTQHIVVLHVSAKPGEPFKGKTVCRTLEHLGLRHGKYKIYHRESLQNPDISLFSVANMVKPGYFEPDAIESFTTPGLSFFLVLPGPPDPVTTFNEMVQTARQVAQSLGGELLDAERSTFSMQRAQLIQDEIVNFMHQINDD